MTHTAQDPGMRPSDRWIPWYFVLFFVVLIGVLAPMAYLAVRTLPGVVTENAYEKGLAYNKSIAAGEKEKALGWRGQIDFVPSSEGRGRVSYALSDAQGQPLSDAKVQAWFVRPTQKGMDKEVDLTSAGTGRYDADVSLAVNGVWDVRISATRENANFQSEKRIVVP